MKSTGGQKWISLSLCKPKHRAYDSMYSIDNQNNPEIYQEEPHQGNYKDDDVEISGYESQLIVYLDIFDAASQRQCFEVKK